MRHYNDMNKGRIMLRKGGPMDAMTVVTLLLSGVLTYAAWLTSIVFCAVNGLMPLLVVAALFFPVGVVHGVGVWLGVVGKARLLGRA